MRTKYTLHPSWSSPHTGDDYTPAKTLMRGLSTYFKGSFEFSKRPRESVKLSRSEGKFSLAIFSLVATPNHYTVNCEQCRLGIDPGLGRTL